MPTKPKARRSLGEFRKDKQRAKCPVCKLTPNVRAQIREAREAASPVPFSTIIEWLKEEHGTALTVVDFTRHAGARHDA